MLRLVEIQTRMPGIMVERQRRDDYLFELATLEINAIWRMQFLFNAAKIK